MSTRSGSPQIWIANSDGSNPACLTSLQGSNLNPPAWSPDGQRLTFCAQPEAESHTNLFVIPAGGGSPARLTASSFDENMPAYSRDGRWIYFNSIRSGRRQVWKMPASGGDAVQVTTGGGLRPVESADGKTIYYVAESSDAIWKIPAGGGKETKVVSGVNPAAYGFAVTAEGLYFRDCCSKPNQFIRFFSFDMQQSWPVAAANDLPFTNGLSVSPNGKYLIFDQMAKLEMDLMRVENFRIE